MTNEDTTNIKKPLNSSQNSLIVKIMVLSNGFSYRGQIEFEDAEFIHIIDIKEGRMEFPKALVSIKRYSVEELSGRSKNEKE